VLYDNSFIIIPNFLKNQKLNPNMQIGVEHLFDALPKWLKNNILGNGSKGLGNGYETISNGLLKVKEKGKGKRKAKVKEKIETPNIPFDEFWVVYDKKVGKPKSIPLWNKLTNDERSSIIAYIPKYKKAQPNKGFRKDPERFLRDKKWEDEIVEAKSKSRRQSVYLTEEEKEVYR